MTTNTPSAAASDLPDGIIAEHLPYGTRYKCLHCRCGIVRPHEHVPGSADCRDAANERERSIREW